MALTQFAFGAVAEGLPTFYVRGATVESVTPSGTAAATTMAATSAQRICRVATDTQVYVSFGAAPNASTDLVRFLVLAGTTEYFRVSSADKASVVTV